MKRFLRRIVDVFILPPAGPLWLALVGALLLFTRWRKAGRWVIGLALFTLYALCTPMVQSWLTATVDHYPPLPAGGEGWEDAQAIVVLGAGVQWGSQEWGGDAPSSMAIARLRYAAEVYRHTQLPVLVTGYTGDGMKVVMERDFGVPVKWIEGRSYDTIQNAEKTNRILRREGIKKVYLVTHFWHMPRSVLAFDAVGMDVVPAPMGFVGYRPDERPLDRVRPRAGPLFVANLVIHEWIGLAWYWWRYSGD